MMHSSNKHRLTSSRWQHEDKLLGISDVDGRHRHKTMWLPNFDPVGEADEVEAITRSQIPQNGEQSFFSLTGEMTNVRNQEPLEELCILTPGVWL